jgi:hypothetical protein
MGLAIMYLINSDFLTNELSANSQSSLSEFFSPFKQDKRPFNMLVLGGDKVNKNSDTMMLMNFDPVKTASFLLPIRTTEQLQKLKNSVASINEEVVRPVNEKEICASLKKGFIDVLGINLIEEKLSNTEKKLAHKLINKYQDIKWSKDKNNLFKI